MDIQLLASSTKPDIFTTIFQHVRLFSEHVSIVFSPTGIYCQVIDSSRISILELNLPAGWFDVYSFTSAGDIVLGLNSAILFKILNAREKQQRIQLVYENDDSLAIHFTSEDKSVFDKHFQCPLVDIENETMVIPDIDYSAEFSLPSATFSVLINQLKTFGDSLEIQCTEEHIQMTAKSPESGTMSVEVNIDDLSEFAINEGEELNLSFSLLQLHHICMFNKISKEMSVRLCPDYPLSIVYPITTDAHLKIYLAPKISDD